MQLPKKVQFTLNDGYIESLKFKGGKLTVYIDLWVFLHVHVTARGTGFMYCIQTQTLNGSRRVHSGTPLSEMRTPL